MTVKEFYEYCATRGYENFEFRHKNWYQDFKNQKPIEDGRVLPSDINVSIMQREVKV